MDFQEQGTSIQCTFSRMCISEFWSSATGGVTQRHKHVMAAILEPLDNVENINIKDLESRVLGICKSIDRYWKLVSRSKSRFLNSYRNWLDVIENVNLKRNSEESIQEPENQPEPSRGRPRKSFEELSKRSKRRRLADLCQLDSSTVNTLLDTSDKSNTSVHLNNISADEVLSVLVEAKLTKHQYLIIKDFINSKTSSDILPCYQKVLSAKKKCYPDNLSITESKAEIELQNLLDHTACRILESQKCVLDRVPSDSANNLTLIGEWGFDGSTGQSEYKQRFSDSSSDNDSSLFVTSYVPLQLIANSPLESIVLWKNPRPSSTRYCRPIRFQFLKESTAVSKEEEAYFKNKISNLTPTTFSYDNRDFHIKHALQLTMVDGKVCTALSDSSSCKCYICGATPKEMNKIDLCLQKTANENRYEFGLSPLHSWIRFFEYFIHLSYRIDIKKWQVRLQDEKKLVADRKLNVQKEFRLKLGLIVDKPRSGGSGTSNDGNTARKFFSNSQISAEITGLRRDLIDRCYIILQALSSGFNIDSQNFNKYALETAHLLIEEYPWFNLPASVHKILVHGGEVAKNALLSIGELSEEAAESNNKHYKTFRQDHTRKMSRELTNTDLLNRLLLSSDPFITSLRKLPRKKKSILSKQVLDLLRI